MSIHVYNINAYIWVCVSFACLFFRRMYPQTETDLSIEQTGFSAFLELQDMKPWRVPG